MKTLGSTVCLAFVLMAIPFLSFMFLKQNISKLKTDTYVKRSGSLYLNLKTSHFRFVMTTVLFFSRRLIFAFRIVFFGAAPFLQACLQILSSFFILTYMIYVKPFVKRKILYFEIFNEMTLLTCSYFLLVFCDILMDNYLRISVGWYMVVVTLFNVLVNYLSLIYTLGKKLFKKIRRKCLSPVREKVKISDTQKVLFY